MNRLTIRFKRLDPRARMPVFASDGAAGADICSLPDVEHIINPGETAMIHTGLALEIPAGYAGFIYARSGLASRDGLAPANKVGVIDSDYRGELIVALHNHSDKPAAVCGGSRIAQLVIMQIPAVEYTETDSLSDSERGCGGFGSTGK